MTQKIIQKLTVYLNGGQTIEVPFNAEKAEALNPQIEAFLKALGNKEKREGNFLFQGARVVIIRLVDVSGADVVSLIQKESVAQKEEKAPAK